MSAPKVIDVFRESHLVKCAGERRGITAPEVSEAYNCSRQTAWNTLERLVRKGLLIKTTRKRRRTLLFRREGQGSWIYVANPNPPKD